MMPVAIITSSKDRPALAHLRRDVEGRVRVATWSVMEWCIRDQWGAIKEPVKPWDSALGVSVAFPLSPFR